jgi:hypothetical protein
MTRALTAAVEAEIALGYHKPFRLFFGDFPTPWRTWTGYGTLDWGGHEWVGIGDALKMSASEETVDTGGEGLELVLSGVDPAKLSLVLSQDISGRDVEIWFGFLDASNAIIPDPWLEYAGLADLLSHTEDGREAVLSLKLETPWSDTDATNFRYTDASQKGLFPGDEFFGFAARHSIQPSTWIVK